MMNGSFGNVNVRGLCAIKSLVNDDCFPYFVREAAALKLLDNKIPNIVHLRKIEGDRLYLQRHSCNLKEASDKLDFEPKHIYAICYKLIVALYNLQMVGLSHRDVKLENILCDIYGEEHVLDVFLCDFGLARYHNGHIPEHITGTIQTEFYRAPELLFEQNDKEHDINNIDIWSLGICMIILLKLDMLLPQIFTEEEYRFLYGNDSFPVDENTFKQYDIDIEFIYVIKMMLTMDWRCRAPASVLLYLPFFDKYRTNYNTSKILTCDDIISLSERRNDKMLRLYNLAKSKASYEEDYNKFIEVLPFYHFNNKESAQLAEILYTMLYGLTKLTEDDISEIAALASMIYDAEIMLHNKDRCIELLQYLDYDLMWSV